jgi:4'-phosphopantetheinyl transferase
MNRSSEHPGIGIWIAEYQSGLDLNPLLPLLSADERAHLAAFKSPRRRDEYVIGRALGRTVLGAYLDLTPSEVRLVIEPEGRPRLDPTHESDLGFSISHTDHMVVLAISKSGMIGIDVESRTGERDVLGLGRRFFHAVEQEYISASFDERERQERFLDVWTLKEAYLKAKGTGVRGRLASFGFDFEAAVRQVRFLPDTVLEHGSGVWDFQVLHPTAEHVLALAYEAGRATNGDRTPTYHRCELPTLGVWGFETSARWSSAR